MADDIILDTWAALSHKAPMRRSGTGWQAPVWVGIHGRRLTAYRILTAYLENVARQYLDVDSAADRDKRREYGDPALFVETAIAALLGDSMTVVVPDAAEFVSDDDTGPEGTELRARVETAKAREDWLADWMKREHGYRKIRESENHGVGLGDAVLAVRWSSRKRRPLLRVYDPGFFFPVLSADDEDEFPSTVHLAWEYEDAGPDGRKRQYVRRITYRLAPIGAEAGETRVRWDGDTEEWVETVGTGERETRTYRYADEPSGFTCLMSDGVWELSATRGATVPDLSEAAAEWAVNEDGVEIHNLDLDIDFIPVVHIPNTAPVGGMWGKSLLLKVAQVFDDLAGSDTDTAATAKTTGAPIVAFIGARSGETAWRPGMSVNLPEGGKLELSDTSKSLIALHSQQDRLLSRAETNARLPGAVLGRIDPSKIDAGIILALSFGPLDAHVAEMREMRGEKHPLILKFAQRMAIQYGQLPPGPALDAELVFGSYLPTDVAAAIDQARKLVGQTVPLTSRRTALELLRAAGVPVEDVAAELEAAEHEDFDGAVRLLEATGDEAAVAAYLGRDVAEQQEPDDGAAGDLGEIDLGQ